MVIAYNISNIKPGIIDQIKIIEILYILYKGEVGIMLLSSVK